MFSVSHYKISYLSRHKQVNAKKDLVEIEPIKVIQKELNTIGEVVEQNYFM